MDSMDSDKELVSEMFSLLGKELKASKKRIKELEGTVRTLEGELEVERSKHDQTQAQHGRPAMPTPQIATLEDEQPDRIASSEESMDGLKKRAEAAEHAMEVLLKRVNELGGANDKLSIANETLHRQLRVKKEDVVGGSNAIGDQYDSTLTNGALKASAIDELKRLEKALARYQSKYKSQKEAKAELKSAYAALENEMRKAQEDAKMEIEGLSSTLKKASIEMKFLEEMNDKLTAKYREKVAATESMATSETVPISSTRQLPNILADMAVRIPATKIQFRKVIDSRMIPLRPCGHRPPNKSMKPVCTAGTNLKSLLESVPELKFCASNFLYIPDRMGWCRPDSHHAFLVAPMWRYHIFDKTIQQSNEFNDLCKQTFSLFYAAGGLVYYSGTYQGIDLRSSFPNGIDLNVFSAKEVQKIAIRKAAIVHSGGNALVKKPRSRNGGDIYKKNNLPVQVMGLQCVGFDLDIYRVIKSRYEARVDSNLCDDVAAYPELCRPPRKKRKT